MRMSYLSHLVVLAALVEEGCGSKMNLPLLSSALQGSPSIASLAPMLCVWGVNLQGASAHLAPVGGEGTVCGMTERGFFDFFGASFLSSVQTGD